jgi:hypothetical protein
VQYCFHHIPKTAGSSLQLRLSHRESIGQLPKGSTLVVYPLYDDVCYYRVSKDPDFDPKQTIKEAFLRTWKQKTTGDATIVMGHYTNITQPGKHFVWLREPLARDISHFNYDYKFNNQLHKDFATHLSMMNGNFMVLWLYGKYCGKHDSVSMEQRYNHVKQVLKTKVAKVYDTKYFEDSWNDIAKMLKVDAEPRLKSNLSDKDYNTVTKYEDLSEEFKVWHKEYNHYDYKLYKEFCV